MAKKTFSVFETNFHFCRHFLRYTAAHCLTSVHCFFFFRTFLPTKKYFLTFFLISFELFELFLGSDIVWKLFLRINFFFRFWRQSRVLIVNGRFQRRGMWILIFTKKKYIFLQNFFENREKKSPKENVRNLKKMWKLYNT